MTSELVKEANAQISLYTVLKAHKIHIEKNGSEWGNNIICPFPSHKDHNASFGYNFSKDIFNCFGCKKSGRAVEFLSAKHDVTLEVAAKKIIELYGKTKTINREEEQNNTQQILKKLIEYGAFFNQFIQKHKDNPKMLSTIDKCFWVVDIYLIASQKVSIKSLEYRLKRVKEIFDELSNSR